MRGYCLPALAGAAGCLALPVLPGATGTVLLCLAGIVALGWRRTRRLAAVAGGALWALVAATAQLADRLPAAQSGNDFSFEAQVVDFASESPGVTRILVRPFADSGLPRRLRLAWYDPEATPQPGERWRLTARLKRPRGSRNPGGFDYAGWLHREGIGATGYLRDAERIADEPAGRWRLRRALVERIDNLLPPGDARAALLAIALGARHRLDDSDWQLFAVTGTSHLMAISGLHIGLAATAAGFVAASLLGLLLPAWPRRGAAAGVAVLAAGGYAALSGFAVPAQRAFLVTAVVAACFAARRPLAAGDVLAGVALVVFLLQPLALLTPGYWLSFGAVALLLHAAGARRPGASRGPLAWFADLGRLQFVLFFGLLPVTVFLFGRLAWLAPLANALALPVFSFVTVPAALAGLLLDGPFAVAGDALLRLAWHSLRAVLWCLQRLAGWPGAVVQPAQPGGFAALLLCLPLAAVLLPRGSPGRALGWLGLVCLLAWREPPPPAGCADLHLLDVGQGLSAVVRSGGHHLVFDAGPAWRSGGDSAGRVLLPLFRAYGIKRVDRLVVSHADLDHAGGAATLTAAMPVGRVLVGEPTPALPGASRCRAGLTWRRGNVTFRLLHPPAGWRGEGNDASCVLEVAAGERRLLLTGDIGRAVEGRLVAAARLRPSDLVVVPHHGSRSSSSPAFVQTLRAGVALVPAGHGNRWGFPKDDVVARWRRAGATVLNTATSGAIHYRLCPSRAPEIVDEFRRSHRRYWHDIEPSESAGIAEEF